MYYTGTGVHLWLGNGLPHTWVQRMYDYVYPCRSLSYPRSTGSCLSRWLGAERSYRLPHKVEGIELHLRYQGTEAGPLFWAQYSFLGLDPVGLKDEYCPSYFHEMRNLTLVNRAYCIRNPKHYKGFGPDCWGLTASYSVDGYAAHSPNEQDDKGVISPTAALSSIVYTPEYSMQVMRHLYNMGDKVFGPFGFYDAFSETDNWYPQRYLAIDQGPIAVMIENYRTGLLWKLFMSHPDVQAGLTKLGFNTNKQDVRQK